MENSYRFFGAPDQARYGDHRHPELPWGYWLTSTGEIPGEPPLVDEDGREWDSVREAFWVGRLGLPMTYGAGVNEILEFMLSYLAIKDSRFVAPEESARDIFVGDGHLGSFFGAFMRAAGLMEDRTGRPTAEGRAVLLMLIATRTRDDADEEIGLDWIAATRSLARAKERRATSDLVVQRERIASRMAHRFATDEIAGDPVVKLIGLRITREVPVRSTLWSMSWPDRDQYGRDRFYLWLLERIDRWDAWSEMVTEDGSRALTEHLMKLAFCDRFARDDGTEYGGGRDE
ncbi:MAG: hypothetical protein KKE77_06760 [Alphaproteobacteria bacterium]|nr:hypothetical protein [Alphaproteobacteria bacterium]